MTPTNTGLLARLPSLKSLLVFNVAAKHLNLVRAAEELCLTQSALSRQIKSLEEHLGIALFERRPRGLRFTQEGELLYDFTCRAFDMLGSGLGRLTLHAERQSLVVSVARSFAIRALAPRIDSFIQNYPWIDLRIDVHRYFADLESSGADISIRLGTGDWPDYQVLRLTDDVLLPVCVPGLADSEAGIPLSSRPLLRNIEREYWQEWNQVEGNALDIAGGPVLTFNDSATMIAAVESGIGFAVTRLSLVSDALAAGRLVRAYPGEAHDGLNYYAVCAQRSSGKTSAVAFMQWLGQAFPLARASTPPSDV